MEQMRVVIEGKVIPGVEPGEARSKLAALFKQSELVAARLLMGQATVVKSGVDTATAERYLEAMRAIGVACRMEPETLDFDSGLADRIAGPPSYSPTSSAASTRPNPAHTLNSNTPIAQPARDRSSLSDKWRHRFAIFDKAGGAKWSDLRKLPRSEARQAARFNVLAFLFGPFYYFAKGMWLRGFTLLFVTTAAFFLVGIFLDLMSASSRVFYAVAFGFAAVYGATANFDYYRSFNGLLRNLWRDFWLSLVFLVLVLLVVGLIGGSSTS